MKKYTKVDTDKAYAYVDCLQKLAVPGPTEDYTKEWVDNIYRGGLFKVNNTAFSFFRELELKVQVVIVSLVTKATKSNSDDKGFE